MKQNLQTRIFIIHLTATRLTFRIHKELLQVNKQKADKPTEKWPKDLNSHSTKEGIYMACKHMTRFSISLVIKKMQSKITMKKHSSETKKIE